MNIEVRSCLCFRVVFTSVSQDGSKIIFNYWKKKREGEHEEEMDAYYARRQKRSYEEKEEFMLMGIASIAEVLRQRSQHQGGRKRNVFKTVIMDDCIASNTTVFAECFRAFCSKVQIKFSSVSAKISAKIFISSFFQFLDRFVRINIFLEFDRLKVKRNLLVISIISSSFKGDSQLSYQSRKFGLRVMLNSSPNACANSTHKYNTTKKSLKGNSAGKTILTFFDNVKVLFYCDVISDKKQFSLYIYTIKSKKQEAIISD